MITGRDRLAHAGRGLGKSLPAQRLTPADHCKVVVTTLYMFKMVDNLFKLHAKTNVNNLP